MKKTYKRMAALLALAFVGVAVSGCHSSDEESKQIAARQFKEKYCQKDGKGNDTCSVPDTAAAAKVTCAAMRVGKKVYLCCASPGSISCY